MKDVKETRGTDKSGAKTKNTPELLPPTKVDANVQARPARPAAGTAGRKSSNSTGSGGLK